MHLLIDNYSVKLEVEAGQFKISNGETVRFASALRLSSICFLKPCTVTTAALELAAEHEVPVMIINEIGDVTAWLWSPRYGTIAGVRVNQAFFSKSKAAVQWMQKIISMKLQEQAQVLAWLATRITAAQQVLQQTAGFISQQNTTLGGCQAMTDIMGTEAMASKQYWTAVAGALHKYIAIPGRVKRGAADPFNICLNYLYGVLYGQIEQSLLMAGADPYMGFMHVNRHARPALAFDHIEPFRPWVDKLVIQLFMKTNDFQTCLVQEDESAPKYLNSEGKKLLLNDYFRFMEQKSYLAGKRIKNKDHIHYLSRELVKTLKNFNIHDTEAYHL